MNPKNHQNDLRETIQKAGDAAAHGPLHVPPIAKNPDNPASQGGKQPSGRMFLFLGIISLVAPIVIYGTFAIVMIIGPDESVEFGAGLIFLAAVLSLLIAPGVWLFTFLALKEKGTQGIDSATLSHIRIGMRFAMTATILWIIIVVAVVAVFVFLEFAL